MPERERIVKAKLVSIVPAPCGSIDGTKHVLLYGLDENGELWSYGWPGRWKWESKGPQMPEGEFIDAHAD